MAPTGPTEPTGPCELEKKNAIYQSNSGSSSQVPTVPKCGRSEVKPMRMTTVRDQVLTHLQVHHGFHVCRWDPRGHEDQVHPQHQQDQGCQGNHAPPTKGKMKLNINLTCVLVAFKLGKDEQVY